LPTVFTALSTTHLVTLVLSPVDSFWFSEKASGNCWVGFQRPFCFYITPHFCKPLSLLIDCFMLISCLICFWTLKMEVTCSSKTWLSFNGQTT
jgi:hypothetical protein